MRLLLALFSFAGSLAATAWFIPPSVAPSRAPVGVERGASAASGGLFELFDRGLRLNATRHEAWAEAHAAGADAVEHAMDWVRSPADDAALDRAAAELRRGRTGRAMREARRVLALASDPDLRLRAWLLLAVAATEQGDHEAALDAWAAAQDEPANLDARWSGALPWLSLRLAHAARESDDARLAMQLADRALAGLERNAFWHHARLEAARARLRIPEHRADGIARARRMLALYPELPFDHLLTLDLVEALLHAGERHDARTLLDPWRFAWPDHALAPRAEALSQQLSQSGAPPIPRSWRDYLDGAKSLQWERRWDAAEVYYREAESRGQRAGVDTATENRILFERATNAWESARFDECIRLLDDVEARGGAGLAERELVRWRIRCISRVGRVDEAWELANAHYRDRSRSDARAALLEYAVDFGRWSDARELRRLSGLSERTFEGAFYAYMARDLDDATSLFEQLAQSHRGAERARYAYWLGRTRLRAGRVDAARAAWQMAIDAAPTNYYGLQAENRLLDLRLAERDVPPSGLLHVAARPGRIHWNGAEGEPHARLSTLERTHPDIDFFDTWQEASPPPGSIAVLARRWGHLFPDARRAQALFDLGLGEEARTLLRDVALEFRTLDALFARGRDISVTRPIRLDRRLWEHEIDNRSSPRGYWGIQPSEPRWPVPTARPALQAYVDRHGEIRGSRAAIRDDLLAALAEVGDPWAVRRSVFDRGSLHGSPMEGGDARRRWLMAYPLAYGPLIEPHARAYDLNPLLLLGLMIVESDMNPDSVSRADAYGLLQVIPRTGQLIALARGDATFGIHSLLEPAASISYGMWYLNELLVKFRGQEILAMVAYNAGPHQVHRWLDWRGNGMDIDEFLETIPFNGARRYPMRILQYLSIYRGIHGGDRSVYIGTALDPDCEMNIYF